MEVQILKMRVPLSQGAYSCAGGEGFGRQSPWMPSRRDSSLDLRGLERTKRNIKPAPSLSYDRSWVSGCILKKKVLVARSSQAGEQAALVSLRRAPQGWVFCPVQEELGLLASSSFIYVFDYLFTKIIVPGSQSTEEGSVQNMSGLCHV